MINGLNAIIEEQEKRFGDRCVHITDVVVKVLEKEDSPDLMHISKAQDTISRLKNVDLSIRFILSHPEHILQPKVKQLLMTEKWSYHTFTSQYFKHLQITHVVIDEAHLVLTWGKQEFRPAYMKIGLIKTFLKKDTKILALTATANLSAQKKITSALQMVNPAMITGLLNRPDVFLEVRKRPPSTGGVNCKDDAMFKTVDPYLHELKVQVINFLKTVMSFSSGVESYTTGQQHLKKRWRKKR
ncbi:recQ [Mytilus coruscus]|uniref:DNA 3'-5' helicase n=1 Tax=Mytilus coruscus TaxID=42192 RepID=A0A6J8EHA6_MYTCO|nr:recQ [Mytilus coruscus]